MSACLVLAVLLVGALTLSDPPMWRPESLAYAAADGWSWRSAGWMLAHADLLHLAGNLVVLCLLAPAVERYRGSGGLLVALLLGHLGALGTHVLTHGPTTAIYGASGAAFAVIGYTAAVSWRLGSAASDTSIRSSRLLRPGALLALLAAGESVRSVAAALTGTSSGAAAHLGALGAGMVAAGLVHGGWRDAIRPAGRRAAQGVTSRG